MPACTAWLVRRLAALGGGLLGCIGVAAALQGEGPAPPWLLRLFALWCIATPYWWYLEHRLWCPAEATARREFHQRQAYSVLVWLGFCIAMAVLITRRGG